MDHVITVREVFLTCISIVGALGLLGVIALVISIMASEFNH